MLRAALAIVTLSLTAQVVLAVPVPKESEPAKNASSEKPSPPVKPATSSSNYVLTETTEVLLDRQPCRYDDVPDSAVIVRMELAPDRRTILSIQFRSGK